MSTSNDDNGDSKTTPVGFTRRQFLPLLGAAAVAATIPRIVSANNSSDRDTQARARYVYVGTYTAPGTAPGGKRPSTATGIYVFKMNPRDGNLDLVEVVKASNPSFLALNPSKTHLYSVNEDEAGRVSAYSINANGTLTFVNTTSASGMHPCHLSVHPSGQYLLAANYSSGNMPV
ncbi:MAG TPA: beta-propeller fold lactonase family protein, partial [Burkholderiales bacterium]|nr:beta-propeller fold lactonase family protein [Burkholderiales bacterium]